MFNQMAAPTLKESCIMGSTWTRAAFQSVVICFLTCSDSRQHMVLYLSLERQILDPRTSASAVKEEEKVCRNQKCGQFSQYVPKTVNTTEDRIPVPSPKTLSSL